MSQQLTIFGAGLSGLIAAKMLSERRPMICDSQASLPNNHHAVLRFRSSIVGDVTNIPFKKVSVSKWVRSSTGNLNPIRDAALYSIKATGKLQSRSIMDLKPVDRYIAPPDLVGRLASTAHIDYGIGLQEWSNNLIRDHGPVISTIPMPAMMEMFGWPDKPEFNRRSGWTLKAKVLPEYECEMYSTVYSAVENDIWYRASITGDELMIEGAGEPPKIERSTIFAQVAEQFGLKPEFLSSSSMHPSKYQKISELDGAGKESAKRFIMHLSSEYQIYSLGRFATWRPKLLLDDLVNDVRVIARLIDGESNYNQLLSK